MTWLVDYVTDDDEVTASNVIGCRFSERNYFLSKWNDIETIKKEKKDTNYFLGDKQGRWID